MVGQLDPALLVEHQNAGTHALQNQSVEGFKAGDFAGALFGEIFADFQAPDQALDQQRCGKTQGAQGSGLQIVIGAQGMAQAQQEA